MYLQIRLPVVMAVLLLAGCLDKEQDIPTSAATANAASDASITLNGTPDAEAVEGSSYFYQPLITQANLGPVTFWVSGQPAWMSLDQATGVLSGVPTEADVGTTGDIVITATTRTLSGSVGPFRVKVKRRDVVPTANSAPLISGTPATSVTAGSAYRFAPAASDPNGNTLSFAITNKPAWATFDTLNGVLAGTPAATDVGTFASVGISVSDGQAATALPAFSIRVMAANHAPTIAGTPSTSVTAGQAYSFVPSATDADGDTLSFSISNKPAWANFNTATGALTGTPGSTQAGNYSGIAISVSDGVVTVTLTAFTLQVVAVAPTNAAPTISGTPATTVNAGSSYAFMPTAGDANNDPLSFTVQNKPAWAAFSTSNGGLSGTPTSAQVGTFANIVIAVSDGKVSSPLPAFSIQVKAVNRPPTVSGTPATSVVAGQAYSFAPTATDPDGNTLGFSIANKPAWASFNTSTGALTGTPTTAQAGSYANVTISVSDGTASAALAAFSIVVTAPPSNGSATLSWSAPTQNADGSSLTDLAGYRINYGTDVSNLSQVIDVADPSLTTYTISSLSTGTWYFTVKSYASTGNESAATSPVSKML